MNNSNIIVLFLVIIAALAIFTVTTGEGFCNCTGLGWTSSKPTYYVYRPTQDVTYYGQTTGQTTNCPDVIPEQDLGWRTGMPYDHFQQSMKSNSWAAGADPNPAVSSSVPYMQNYGCAANATMLSNANNMLSAAKACPFSAAKANVGVL
jgi:hypothetical protein